MLKFHFSTYLCSSDVAETTSLLTNSPMENAEVSASAVIDGTANFILGFSNSSMRKLFQFIQFVILHAQSIDVSWHITFYGHHLGFLIESQSSCQVLYVGHEFFYIIFHRVKFQFLQASKAACIVLPSLANLLMKSHLKVFLFLLCFCLIIFCNFLTHLL